MNSNQRRQGNNQSDKGGNDLPTSASRAGTEDKNKLNQPQQSGALNSGSQQQGGTQPGGQQGVSQSTQQSTDRTGSQTGAGQNQQGMPDVHQSNDLAGGMPRSPGGNRQSADEKMDDDTGLSNTANRNPSEVDQKDRQERQSNVGRRDDGTPD